MKKLLAIVLLAACAGSPEAELTYAMNQSCTAGFHDVVHEGARLWVDGGINVVESLDESDVTVCAAYGVNPVNGITSLETGAMLVPTLGNNATALAAQQFGHFLLGEHAYLKRGDRGIMAREYADLSPTFTWEDLQLLRSHGLNLY